MELGNLVFGHSRGNYPVPRDAFEEEIWRLFDELKCSLYGTNFDNDVFSVFPYYWGDCTCGFDDAEIDWEKANPHSSDCYQIDYHRITQHKHWEENEEVKALCEKHGLSYPDGCAIHCTCGRRERFGEWLDSHYHSENCPIIRPNFHFKPFDFTISWYKYPFRDSYMNQQVSLSEFSEMIDRCIDSLDKKGE